MGRYYERKSDGSLGDSFAVQQNPPIEYIDDASPELVAFLNPPPIDQSDLDNTEKSIKALALVVAQWNGKTIPQLKAAFRVARDSLP